MIDTSFVGALIGVFDKAGELLSMDWSEASQDAASRLPNLCDQAIEKAGISIDAIEQIVVGLGPGSFTGIKIGISFVQGFLRSKPNVKIQGTSGFFSWSGQNLEQSEIALLPCTVTTGYFFAPKQGQVVKGLIQEDMSWALEIRDDSGEILNRDSWPSFSKIHILGELRKFNQFINEKDIKAKLVEHKLQHLGESILKALYCGAKVQGFCDADSLRPIYLKKSAPEERLQGPGVVKN